MREAQRRAAAAAFLTLVAGTLLACLASISTSSLGSSGKGVGRTGRTLPNRVLINRNAAGLGLLAQRQLRRRRQIQCHSEAEIRAITKQTMDYLMASAPEGSQMREAVSILDGFMNEYADSNIKANTPASKYKEIMTQSVKLMGEALAKGHQFDILHRAIREPFDYYRFGVEFFRPLLEMDSSKLLGGENLEKIVSYIERGENVILLSNHQTEVDPQAIEILLEEADCDLASQLIFVAGHKVTTDPLAIPFSLGQNLLSIHSKKYIENPPEKKAEKQAHNTKTMKKMQGLLEEGGTFLWVAPSGGRDRPDPLTREFVVAPFDERSIQMFKLMAQKAEGSSGRKTHFFPMSMLTHELVPPPDGIKAGVGEKRSAKRGAACIWFGDEVTDDHSAGRSKEAQKIFYDSIMNQVIEKYDTLKNDRSEQLKKMAAQI